jgi:hypothetical protein
VQPDEPATTVIAKKGGSPTTALASASAFTTGTSALTTDMPSSARRIQELVIEPSPIAWVFGAARVATRSVVHRR